MNILQAFTKVKSITSFLRLHSKLLLTPFHTTSNVTPNYYFYLCTSYKMSQQAMNFLANSKLGNEWKFQNSPQNMTCYNTSTCVYKAPTSYTNPTNLKSLSPNSSKCKLGNPNYNFILPFVWSFSKKNLVDSSISKKRNFQRWVDNHFKELTNLPLMIMYFWHL
jgi:hypothetical protein